MKSVEIGGAITILNAISTQIGATVGTDIVHTISLNTSDKLRIDTGDQNIGPELVEHCIDIIRKLYGIAEFKIDISIRAGYPPSKGMKTSSAISLGVLYLLSEEYGLELTDNQIIELSAEASVNAGVSITGAIDDAYACWKGGYWVTQNATRKILLQNPIVNLNKSVIFLIPKGSTLKSTINLSFNKIEREKLIEAKDLALQGEWENALKINTLIHATHLLENPDLIRKISEHVNGIVGLNGAGPALFVIINNRDIDRTQASLVKNFPEFTLRLSQFR